MKNRPSHTILVIINHNFKNPFSRILFTNCPQSGTKIIFALLFADLLLGRPLINFKNEKRLVGERREAEKPTQLDLSTE